MRSSETLFLFGVLVLVTHMLTEASKETTKEMLKQINYRVASETRQNSIHLEKNRISTERHLFLLFLREESLKKESVILTFCVKLIK